MAKRAAEELEKEDAGKRKERQGEAAEEFPTPPPPSPPLRNGKSKLSSLRLTLTLSFPSLACPPPTLPNLTRACGDGGTLGTPQTVQPDGGNMVSRCEMYTRVP